MIAGVLGAAAHNEFRRILSFHIVSQVGYMILGLALNTTLALAGAVFYLIHHIIVKANLFLVSGVVRRLSGSFELSRMGGIYSKYGWTALCFFIPAFSLAGFPPLSGFWAKMMLIRASLDIHHYLVAGIAAAVGLLTVYSMTKIWGEVFWKPAPRADTGDEVSLAAGPSGWMMTPIAGLVILTVIIGYFVKELFISNFRVMWDVITPKHISRPGINGVPLDAKTDLEIMLVANLISLTPGTLNLDVSEDKTILYVHVMFLDDVEEACRTIKEGLERRVLEVMR